MRKRSGWKAIPCPFEHKSERDMPGNRGFSVSTNGRFVFLPAPKTETQLTWVDRSGRPVGIVGAPGFSGGNLDVSPDGQQLAFSKPGHPAERAERYLADRTGDGKSDASDG